MQIRNLMVVIFAVFLVSAGCGVSKEEFEQKVESMQIEHEQVEKAKKGDEIAIKVDQPTKPGAKVYKV